LHRLFDTDLPRDAKARKAIKPDLEILLKIPCDCGWQLLALGSGSAENRMRGVVIEVNENGHCSSVSTLDLRHLFDGLTTITTEINLEGATVFGDRLLLFNRGNLSNPLTQIFETELAAIMEGSPAQTRILRELALPYVDGVPLTVTDACGLDDRAILLSVVAEATGDAYADGCVVGAAIVLLDSELDIIRVETVEPTIKIEGIDARRAPDGIELLCVSDADDPEMPGSLYSATLRI
jgi:hypothetical protein